MKFMFSNKINNQIQKKLVYIMHSNKMKIPLSNCHKFNKIYLMRKYYLNIFKRKYITSCEEMLKLWFILYKNLM